MKLTVALLSAKIAIATLKNRNCNAPPDLEKGVWNCPSEGSWNHGDVCRISGDDCTGTVKCSKSNWKGNTSKFCPKDCKGYPKQPAFGGSFECADERDWRTCELKVWDGFKCSSSVKCNTQKGVWTGTTKCKFDRAGANNPPARPYGDWSCNKGNCKFECWNGDYGGIHKATKYGWQFSNSRWYWCCPYFGYEQYTISCYNGKVGLLDYCVTDQPENDYCERCDEGYELVKLDWGAECVKKSTLTTTKAITEPTESSTEATTVPTTTPTTTPATTPATTPELTSSPPKRPAGNWAFVGKWRFTCVNGITCVGGVTCDDDRSGGSGKIRKGKWVYTHPWYTCCGAYIFSCENGVVGKSETCPNAGNYSVSHASHPSVRGVDLCESCDSGYDLVGTECLLKSETTTTTAATTTAATTTAATTTEATTTERLENVCKCKNGIEKTGSNCVLHDSWDCEVCDEGWDLGDDSKCQKCSDSGKRREIDENGNDICVQNVCECPNGVASTGENCDVHGSLICASCNFPFDLSCGGRSLSGNMTEHSHERKKRDSHGSSGGWDWCLAWPDRTGNNCKGCVPGYKYNWKEVTCTALECICPNGNPVVGSGHGNQVCNGNGRIRCETCDQGYQLVKDKKKTIYTCEAV